MRAEIVNAAFAVLVALVVLLPWPAHAQGVTDILSRHRDSLQATNEAIFEVKKRMLKDSTEFLRNERAWHMLDAAGTRAHSGAREFNVLLQTLLLTTVVKDPADASLASKVLELQLTYMKRTFAESTELIEELVPYSQTPEAAKLMLRARDELKAAGDLLQRIEYKPGALRLEGS
jgi:hypothetical protein